VFPWRGSVWQDPVATGARAMCPGRTGPNGAHRRSSSRQVNGRIRSWRQVFVGWSGERGPAASRPARRPRNRSASGKRFRSPANRFPRRSLTSVGRCPSCSLTAARSSSTTLQRLGPPGSTRCWRRWPRPVSALWVSSVLRSWITRGHRPSRASALLGVTSRVLLGRRPTPGLSWAQDHIQGLFFHSSSRP